MLDTSNALKSFTHWVDFPPFTMFPPLHVSEQFLDPSRLARMYRDDRRTGKHIPRLHQILHSRMAQCVAFIERHAVSVRPVEQWLVPSVLQVSAPD